MKAKHFVYCAGQCSRCSIRTRGEGIRERGSVRSHVGGESKGLFMSLVIDKNPSYGTVEQELNRDKGRGGRSCRSTLPVVDQSPRSQIRTWKTNL